MSPRSTCHTCNTFRPAGQRFFLVQHVFHNYGLLLLCRTHIDWLCVCARGVCNQIVVQIDFKLLNQVFYLRLLTKELSELQVEVTRVLSEQTLTGEQGKEK